MSKNRLWHLKQAILANLEPGTSYLVQMTMAAAIKGKILFSRKFSIMSKYLSHNLSSLSIPIDSKGILSKRNKNMKQKGALSLYKSASLSMSLFVCLFPNSSETANPSELKFQELISLGEGRFQAKKLPDSLNRQHENKKKLERVQ